MGANATAAIYCRISRDAEGEGLGVERQESLCRELADRHGLTVLEVFIDNDIGASDRTGKNVLRPEYQRMLEEARTGRLGHILAYAHSRLTRRPRELEELVDLHKQTGVVLRTYDSGQVDLTTANGLMAARIMASIDAGESDRISERQKDAFRHNALKGLPKIQRQRPFGWKKDGITIEPEEASLIREAVKKIRAGASVTAIRREWEAAGVLTAAGNTVWEHGSLKRVLVGWRTAGVRTYKREPLSDKNGQLVMGTWAPIISLQERESALAMLEKRSRKKIRQGTWLLSGLVRCGMCGGQMYGQLTETQTYACKPGSGHLAITASLLEDYVLKSLATRLLANESKEIEPERPQEWPKEARLTLVVEKKAEIWAAFAADKIPMDTAIPLSDELDAERKELLKERDDFYATTAEAEIPYRRTSDLLEWAQDLAGKDPHERRHKKRQSAEWENSPWGAMQPGQDESHTLEVDPDIEERKLLLRRELDFVLVKQGQRGRAGWGREALRKRVEILWRD